ARPRRGAAGSADREAAHRAPRPSGGAGARSESAHLGDEVVEVGLETFARGQVVDAGLPVVETRLDGHDRAALVIGEDVRGAACRVNGEEELVPARRRPAEVLPDGPRP